jgi:hypothetical protein
MEKSSVDFGAVVSTRPCLFVPHYHRVEERGVSTQFWVGEALPTELTNALLTKRDRRQRLSVFVRHIADGYEAERDRGSCERVAYAGCAWFLVDPAFAVAVAPPVRLSASAEPATRAHMNKIRAIERRMDGARRVWRSVHWKSAPRLDALWKSYSSGVEPIDSVDDSSEASSGEEVWRSSDDDDDVVPAPAAPSKRRNLGAPQRDSDTEWSGDDVVRPAAARPRVPLAGADIVAVPAPIAAKRRKLAARHQQRDSDTESSDDDVVRPAAVRGAQLARGTAPPSAFRDETDKAAYNDAVGQEVALVLKDLPAATKPNVLVLDHVALNTTRAVLAAAPHALVFLPCVPRVDYDRIVASLSKLPDAMRARVLAGNLVAHALIASGVPWHFLALDYCCSPDGNATVAPREDMEELMRRGTLAVGGVVAVTLCKQRVPAAQTKEDDFTRVVRAAAAAHKQTVGVVRTLHVTQRNMVTLFVKRFQ